ncbi:hypothetical protein LWI28_016427 [Acer negundo]|uniref:Uncharacterized protein n=1 Tax=Acer negundo TaxID=4023 RepID=A0AAD5IFB0_ACENE|nr:hypothetical protein LWI28_016427 [Acer negundo]
MQATLKYPYDLHLQFEWGMAAIQWNHLLAHEGPSLRNGGLCCYSGSDDSILEDKDSLGYEDHDEVGDKIGSLEDTCTNASIDIQQIIHIYWMMLPLNNLKMSSQEFVQSGSRLSTGIVIDSLAGTTSSVVTSPSMGFFMRY